LRSALSTGASKRVVSVEFAVRVSRAWVSWQILVSLSALLVYTDVFNRVDRVSIRVTTFRRFVARLSNGLD
jgi:hypothetical protein